MHPLFKTVSDEEENKKNKEIAEEIPKSYDAAKSTVGGDKVKTKTK